MDWGQVQGENNFSTLLQRGVMNFNTLTFFLLLTSPSNKCFNAPITPILKHLLSAIRNYTLCCTFTYMNSTAWMI